MSRVRQRSVFQAPESDQTIRATFQKTSVFRYKTQIGHLPKEVEMFLYVQRPDPRTGASKVVPEVVYPIQANRPAVPKHKLLEDDWRAFRSVFHNYQTNLQNQMDSGQRMLEYLKCADVVRRIYKLYSKSHRPKGNFNFVPTLAMYKDSMNIPLGYSYRRYKQNCQDSPRTDIPKVSKQEIKVPVLVFEGPCMDVVHIPQGKHLKAKWDREMDYYDVDVIVTKPTKRKLYIFNEPDAIPVSCARNDFSKPLSERAKAAVSWHGPNSNDANKMFAPRMSSVLNPCMPISELMVKSKFFQ